ncbi:MAG: SMP-30/gluconolactonase/LRE family protein [Acidimicrobiales bacterium]
MDRVEVAVRAAAELGEGPVWDAGSGSLVWVDILGGIVHRFTPSDGSDVSFAVGSPLGCAGLREAGGLVVAVGEGFAVWGEDGGGLEPVPGFSIDLGRVRFNDGEVDPWGRFWAGTMHWEASEALGSLYALSEDFSVTPVLDQVTISNGLCWSEECRSGGAGTLYYIDSPTGGIDAFSSEPGPPALSGRRRVIDVPVADGVPDGMALDDQGCLWVALWGAGEVRRYTPEGRLDASIELPVSRVTSVAFGGDALDQLYVTSAREGMGPEQLEAEPLAGSLFVCEPGVRGLSPSKFKG